MTGFWGWLVRKSDPTIEPPTPIATPGMRSYGVRLDSVTDDTSALRAAINHAAEIQRVEQEWKREEALSRLRLAIAQVENAGIERLLVGGARQRERVRAGTAPRGRDGRFTKGDAG